MVSHLRVHIFQTRAKVMNKKKFWSFYFLFLTSMAFSIFIFISIWFHGNIRMHSFSYYEEFAFKLETVNKIPIPPCQIDALELSGKLLNRIQLSNERSKRCQIENCVNQKFISSISNKQLKQINSIKNQDTHTHTLTDRQLNDNQMDIYVKTHRIR